MKFNIIKKNSTLYYIRFHFNKQSCEVKIDISNKSNWHVVSMTDGYHWLHYFMSNKPNCKQLLDLANDDVTKVINESLCKVIRCTYKQDDKESAFINFTERNSVDDTMNILANFMLPRFANRERFFDDNVNFQQHQSL